MDDLRRQYQSIKKKIDDRRRKEQIISLYLQNWAIKAIAKKLKITTNSVRKCLTKNFPETYMPTPTVTPDVWRERRKEITLEYLKSKTTYAEVGKKFGISGDRVSQIVGRTTRQVRIWWIQVERKTFPDGVLLDPDGIGEVNEEWTPERQYEEMINETALV
jgi:transposase-like protein